MSTSVKNKEQEYEGKFGIISDAFGSLVAGISWWSLNLPVLVLCTYLIGGVFITLSVLLIVSSFHHKLISKTEKTRKYISHFLWPFVVLSVLVAVYQAIPSIENDWRFSLVAWVVVIFMCLTIISLLIIVVGRILRKDYNWTNFTSLLIIVIAIVLISYSDFTVRLTQTASLIIGFIKTFEGFGKSADWQVIGTWFTGFMTLLTGIALAVFAYLMWKISQRQQQLQFYPDLIGRVPYSYPEMGNEVFVDKLHIYDGIKWQVEITNPGTIPIEITNTLVEVRTLETGKSIIVWISLPNCTVFDELGQHSNRAFSLPGGRTFTRTLMVYYSEFERVLDQTIGDHKRLQFNFIFSWDGKNGEKVLVIRSEEFELIKNIPLNQRRKPLV